MPDKELRMSAHGTRPLWAKVAALFVTAWVILQNVSAVAGWISGETPGTFAKALQRIHGWLSPVPFAIVDLVMIPLLIVTWWLILRRSPAVPAETVMADGVPNPLRAKRRMDCRPCQGTGRAVTRHHWLLFHKLYEKCQQCEGHGSYVSDLWSQPDCRSCGGRGWVQFFEMNFQRFFTTCPICRGHGKRPYGV
jgi:hypothetical protein